MYFKKLMDPIVYKKFRHFRPLQFKKQEIDKKNEQVKIFEASNYEYNFWCQKYDG